MGLKLHNIDSQRLDNHDLGHHVLMVGELVIVGVLDESLTREESTVMVRPLVDSTVNWIDPEHCAPSELSPQLSMPLHMPTLSMHWPLPHMEMQVPSRHRKVSVCSVRGSSNPHARGNCAPQWHRFWHVKDGRHSCTINANKGRCAS